MQPFAQEAVLTVLSQLGEAPLGQKLHDALLDADDPRTIVTLIIIARSERRKGDEGDTELLRSVEEALEILLEPALESEEPDPLDAQVRLIKAGF